MKTATKVEFLFLQTVRSSYALLTVGKTYNINVSWHTRSVGFGVVLGQAYRGLAGGFHLLWILSVGISVSPHVCFILKFNFDFYISKKMHL